MTNPKRKSRSSAVCSLGLLENVSCFLMFPKRDDVDIKGMGITGEKMAHKYSMAKGVESAVLPRMLLVL